jgi:hypothetical protein
LPTRPSTDGSFGFVPPRLREYEFQQQITGTKPPGIAVIYGWQHVHFRPAQTKHGWRTPGTGSLAKGWPDLSLFRPRDGRIIFAELKGDGGRLTDDEKRVLAILRAVAEFNPLMEVYEWWPKDWDQIQAILR